MVVTPGRGAAHCEPTRDEYVYLVRSRRTRALSIGIDLTSNGACPLACDYCQVTRAGARTRPVPVDVNRLRAELCAALERVRASTDVAFAGSGEPTWAPQFVEALGIARDLARSSGRRVPVRVLTSGTMLHREPVARALADLVTSGEGEVWVKLDAWDAASFRRIARTGGYARTRERIRVFAVRVPIVVQTLVVRREGDPPLPVMAEALAGEIRSLAAAGARIERIELTTLLRAPGDPSGVRAVETRELKQFAAALARTGVKVNAASPDDPVMNLRVRRRDTIDPSGARGHAFSVFCPLDRRAMHLDLCRRCAYVREATDEHVVCAPPQPARLSLDLAAPLGTSACVGDAMGERSISVRADVEWAVAERALAQDGAPVALVVDAEDALVGVVDRDHVGPRRPRTPARDLASSIAPVAEATPLAHAIARMVHERSRALPVVGSDGRVIGLLSDVDALRWVAQRR